MKYKNYSPNIKSTALEKIQGPSGKGIPEVSNEMGIPQNTLYNWIRKASNGEMNHSGNSKSRQKITIQEKFRVIMEFKSLSEIEKGAWLREKGYKEDQLNLWEKEIETELSQKKTDPLKAVQQELDHTKKDLAKKDKALAEVSALLILKKKLDLLLNEDSGK